MNSAPLARIMILLSVFAAAIGLIYVMGFSTVAEKENRAENKNLARITFGEKTIEVEIARTDKERGRGLMFRKSLPEDSGMIFVYDEPVTPSFWMKNTEIPLTIAFINAKFEITDIMDMKPLDTESHHSPHEEILYALEMNKGWFEKNGIKAGDKVKIEFPKEKENEKK